MRVVHFSTLEHTGGAAQAARRLHDALRGAGVESRMIVRYHESGDPNVADVASDRRESLLWDAIERYWIVRNRSDLSNTWFSTGRPGSAAAEHRWVAEADVLHLHWIPGLLASRDIATLLALGKPVVWTLHDEWAFTGGCHYTAGCEQWRTACTKCPQLRADPHGLVQATFADKQGDFASGRLAIVAPSQWLADRAVSSSLFRGRSGEAIQHGLDLAVYAPSGRDARRAELGVRDEDLLLLFAAHDASERRKGFAVLAEALAICARDARLKNVRLVTVGSRGGAAGAVALPFPVVDCGLIPDARSVAATFAACDLFVCPSLEDNSPNTIVEAFACGTPVVGSSAGGIPELLNLQPFRATAPTGDARGLAEVMIAALSQPTALRSARASIRGIAEERFPEMALRGAACCAVRATVTIGNVMSEQSPSSQLDRVAERAALEATLDRIEELERIVLAMKALPESQARLTALVEAAIPRLTNDIASLAVTVGILTTERDRLSAESQSLRDQIERLRHELSLSLPRFVWQRLMRRKVD